MSSSSAIIAGIEMAEDGRRHGAASRAATPGSVPAEQQPFAESSCDLLQPRERGADLRSRVGGQRHERRPRVAARVAREIQRGLQSRHAVAVVTERGERRQRPLQLARLGVLPGRGQRSQSRTHSSGTTHAAAITPPTAPTHSAA